MLCESTFGKVTTFASAHKVFQNLFSTTRNWLHMVNMKRGGLHCAQAIGASEIKCGKPKPNFLNGWWLATLREFFS